MSTPPNNGGPAFPAFEFTDGHGCARMGPNGWESWASGMTLRDYFAAKAIAGLLANTGPSAITGVPHYDDSAKHAYAVADALLAERNR